MSEVKRNAFHIEVESTSNLSPEEIFVAIDNAIFNEVPKLTGTTIHPAKKVSALNEQIETLKSHLQDCSNGALRLRRQREALREKNQSAKIAIQSALNRVMWGDPSVACVETHTILKEALEAIADER